MINMIKDDGANIYDHPYIQLIPFKAMMKMDEEGQHRRGGEQGNPMDPAVKIFISIQINNEHNLDPLIVLI